MLRDPSTFYVFSVVGIDENFADMIDIHRDKMSRKEFCWLTDPQPPVAETRSDTSLVLKWDPIKFCGVDVSVVADSITYILEGCEGQEWRGGIASKFVSDISASEYKLIAKGPKLERIVLEDLKPARWYHFRLTIQYLSTSVTSQTKSFATVCSPPNPPNQPYVYLILNENNMFENRSRQDPQVRLTWNEPNPNGSAIKKYHVQLMEYYDSISEAGNIRSSSLSSPESGNYTEDNEFMDSDSRIQYYTLSSGQKLVGTKWKTVYCNLLKSTLLESPRPRCRAWGIRLRALNSSGWSSYSEVLYLDNQTHGQLFPASTPTQKLPPLQKQPSNITPTSHASKSSHPHHSQSFNHTSARTTGGREFHDGNVDIWTASSSYSGEKYRVNSEGETKVEEEEEKNGRSSPIQAKYHQPRCKTPSLLLPPSPTKISLNITEAVNRSLVNSFKSQQLETSPQINSSVLEKEVER